MSILVSLYGLSFRLQDSQNNETKFFEYTFDNTNPNALQTKLEDIVKERPVLQNNFQKVQIIHHNNLNTFVPDQFFDEQQLRDVLSYNIKILPSDFIEYDAIDDFQTKNVYVPFVAVNNVFLNYNKSIHYEHAATAFFREIISFRKTIQQLPLFEVYLNVFAKDFQVVILKNEKLILFNHFEYENTDEFLYYFFFVIETLKISNEQVTCFVGGISENSQIVKQLKDFYSHIGMFKSKQNSQINNLL